MNREGEVQEISAEDLPLLGEPLPVEFANSLYLEHGHSFDFLATPQRAQVWFDAMTNMAPDFSWPSGLKQAELNKLCELRDAIRAVLLAVVEQQTPSRYALRVLNQYARGACAHATLTWNITDGPVAGVVYKGSANAVLSAQLATAAIELLQGQNYTKLRRCEGPGCTLFFVQHHRRRRFCHASCSQRARQMRYYRRTRDDTSFS